MKKFCSIILSFVIMLAMSMTAFAAESVKFKVTLVSETDTSAVITIDYAGGSAYSCMDMEVKFSSRLSVENTEKGTGLKNFLTSYENSFSASNIDNGIFKISFVSLEPYKAVNGNDLYKITLKKSTSEKLAKDDVKVSVTTCELLKGNSNNTEKLTSSVSYGFDTNAVTTKTTTTKKGETTTNPGETTSVGVTTTVAEDVTENSTDNTQEIYDIASADDESNEEAQNTTDKKKIIIIGAAAVCCLLVIAAGIVFIVSKTKKQNEEE